MTCTQAVVRSRSPWNGKNNDMKRPFSLSGKNMQIYVNVNRRAVRQPYG